jgi:hypothetical protein
LMSCSVFRLVFDLRRFDLRLVFRELLSLKSGIALSCVSSSSGCSA